jgi:glycosyltransferase involved in cell wall biosynthesis
MADEVSRFSPSSSVHVIPDAVDDIFFEPHNRKASRALLGYPNDETPWILFTTVSIDNPVKRASLALNAINHLRRNGQKVELRIASGISPADMPVFVSACDMVLCTSTHEGWPNSVKEALACGLPFVSTDVSDMKMIAEKYPACRVVEPNSLSIADALIETIQNKSEVNLGECVEHLSIEKTCRRLKALYESV